MRLTLRTLLAYLDDTLPPAEARQIGQQVAESDVAQEIVARLQAVLHDRRLSTPPLTGAKLDPNTVAEYLDNDLEGGQQAEVEQILLDFELYLAETAACHQILTLFVGQPMDVPALARKRMYGLAKPQTAAPKRELPPEPEEHDEEEDDDDDELEVPAYLRENRGQRLGALAAVIGLLLLIVLAAWQMWPRGHTHSGETQLASNSATAPDGQPTQPASSPATQLSLPATTPEKISPPTPPPEPPPPVKQPDPPPPDKPPEKEPIDKAPKLGASQERREGIGRQVVTATAMPNAILLSRRLGAEQWQRVAKEGPVATTDTLLSLPGYRVEVHMESQVRLTLAGNLPDSYPEFTPQEFPALESSVVLHVPPTEFDADMTLERGRILLASTKAKGEARIRVRLASDELWDVVLPDTRSLVCIERTGAYMPDTPFDKTGKGEGPMFFVYMWGLKGQATISIRYREVALPEKSFFAWNSRQGAPQGPQPAPALPRWFTETKPPSTPYTRDTKVALEELATRLARQPVEVALAETRKEPKPASRILAIRCWAAIDGITHLMDALRDDADVVSRDLATFALRHWIGQNAGNELLLYRTLQTKLTYTALEAEEVMELLHNFSPQARQSPETYEKLIANLTNKQLAIRHLSYWWLLTLVPDGVKIKYDPAGDKDALARGQQDWKKRIPDGTAPAPPKPPK